MPGRERVDDAAVVNALRADVDGLASRNMDDSLLVGRGGFGWAVVAADVGVVMSDQSVL